MANTVAVSTSSDREIRVTRSFDAPRTTLWVCHTRPELVRRWMLGPNGWTMPVCEIDVRVGGGYRYVWRNDSDGSQFGFRGTYRDIVVPERIVHTEGFDGSEPSDSNDALCTLSLSERNGRTTLTYSMLFPTKEIRDQALQTGMTDGMESSYKRLERVMEEHQVAR